MNSTDIAIQVGIDAHAKHVAGKIEHKGELSEKPCWKFIKPEILDLVNYYYTMEHQLRTGIALIREGLAQSNPEMIERGVNVVEFGNEEAVKYED